MSIQKNIGGKIRNIFRMDFTWEGRNDSGKNLPGNSDIRT